MLTECTVSKQSAAKPQPRLALMSEIRRAGYRWNKELCPVVRISETRLSKILNGHDFPGPSTQKRLARALGLTLRELGELL